MADEQIKKPVEQLADEAKKLSNKSSAAIFGMTDDLDNESDDIKDIVRQTMNATSEKYGNRANGKVVNYFNELNFSRAFFDLTKDPSDKKSNKETEKNPDKAFKRYMSEKEVTDISSILSAEAPRMINYANYRAIYNHIPEAAQALDTFKENIMSPDDFTKLIFNVVYDNDLDPKLRDRVEEQLFDLQEKYEFESLADEVIEGSLMYGDQFISILSLEKELDYMLTDPIINGSKALLNEETVRTMDVSRVSVDLNTSDFEKSPILTEAFVEALNLNNKEKELFNEDATVNFLTNLINTNVVIGSKKEFLLERLAAEKDMSDSRVDIPKNYSKKDSKDKKKKSDENPMFINGSTMNVLDPAKVVELKIDNVVYGYYYVQSLDQANVPNAGYLGQSTGREVLNPVNMGSNLVGVNNTKFTPSTNNFSMNGLSDAKVNIISKIFIDSIAKKVNKDFIRQNKEFKDFIFNLIKQDYIIKKQIKLVYFTPDEVVAFKVPALYRKITFFAKLYLAMLTNMLLIKMGRAHDKRVFYVDVGADANYEQAISRVIQDIKTKEFKMDSIGDINTILNLNPGMFDNYYIPTVNGEKPIEIDTLQGMDIDMNNEFLEFLKTSMMSGMGIPRTLIDETTQVDFARTVSSRNANFVRSVIKYQKRLTLPFTKLIRKLYENEYKFSGDKESEILSIVDVASIQVHFPSPATLNMTNITDQMQVVEQNSEFITNTLIPQDPTGVNEGKRQKLKSKIIEDLLPAIDWDKYREFRDQSLVDDIENDIKKKAEQVMGPDGMPMDPNMGQF
jgi:hypothetical protein